VKKLLVAAALVLLTAPAFAQQQTRYYDSHGNSLGTQLDQQRRPDPLLR